jgi:hypothetical protein
MRLEVPIAFRSNRSTVMNACGALKLASFSQQRLTNVSPSTLLPVGPEA